jgi:glycosyltransferase involved in cell wall biosynthesis
LNSLDGKLRVVYTIADLQPESGGPTRSVCALAQEVADCGADVEVVALEYGRGSSIPLTPLGAVKTTFAACHGVRRRFKWSGAFAKVFRERLEWGSNVVAHDNGIWLPTNHAAAKAARVARVPLISSPRGMLTAWSLKFRGLKKRIAWRLYQYSDLRAAKVLHATSREEAEGLRAAGLKQPVAVIPNGVNLPPQPTGRLSTNVPVQRTALFLSRIHPKKGLLDLVKAWPMGQPSDWRMLIAGGDENGHRAEVESAIRARALGAQFEFIGEVADEQKWELYRRADLFVLPTKSENFGIVIAEALACGLPVITTRGTPWEELVHHRCGWWAEIGPEALADALRQAMRLDKQELRAMGLRGQKLVAEKYTWHAAAQKMISVYRWMLGQGSKPDCVVV